MQDKPDIDVVSAWKDFFLSVNIWLNLQNLQYFLIILIRQLQVLKSMTDREMLYNFQMSTYATFDPGLGKNSCNKEK